MRLFELLTEAPPTVKHHEYKSERGSMEPPDARFPTGSGAKTERGTTTLGGASFSFVYGHEDNPHDVMKLSKPAHISLVDGYEAFIEALATDAEMHENPHFPRVQTVRNVRDRSRAERKYMVRMERLYSLNNLSEEEYKVMVKNTFNDSYIYQVQRDLPEWKHDNKWRAVYLTWLEDSFTSSYYIPKKAYAPIKDYSLRVALDKIIKIADDNSLRLDLHSQNIMFRKTQYGPVLVITDPLSGERF